jgi:hypothetical protein
MQRRSEAFELYHSMCVFQLVAFEKVSQKAL